MIDSTDIRILEALQDDARLTNVELARRVHLSPSPCLARVAALRAAGVIRRFVTLLDPRPLGLPLSVFMQVQLEKQVDEALERFEAAIRGRPEIVECYLMTGDADYLLRVVMPDVESLQGFIVGWLTRVPGVKNIRTSFALKQVKYTTALPLAHAPLAAGPRAPARG